MHARVARSTRGARTGGGLGGRAATEPVGAGLPLTRDSDRIATLSRMDRKVDEGRTFSWDEAVWRNAPMLHHDYSKVQEAIEDESTWACVRYLMRRMADGPLFPVADDRFRHPGEEAIRDALKIHPGADRALVRAYFNFRPAGREAEGSTP